MYKYKTNNSLMVYDTKEMGMLIDVNGCDLFQIEKDENEIFKILEAFTVPRTYEEGYNFISKRMYLDDDLFKEYFDIMCENNILKNK